MKEKTDPLKEAEDIAKSFNKEVRKKGKPIFRRYPLSFALLSIFGFAAVIYGFEGIIDKIEYLRDRPYLVLLTGLIVLSVTGTIYKWLQNKELNLH